MKIMNNNYNTKDDNNVKIINIIMIKVIIILHP